MVIVILVILKRPANRQPIFARKSASEGGKVKKCVNVRHASSYIATGQSLKEMPLKVHRRVALRALRPPIFFY
jgi:hypothetical protein